VPVETPHHPRPRMAGEDAYNLSAFNYAYFGDGTAKTVTVPTGATRMLFSATGDFYARCDGSAATIPGATFTDGTASFLNPVEREVGELASFSIIMAAGVIVTIAWYKAP
jgi:hypothetical protein